ncbi:hypothetical protein RWE15_11585 [Virgibacillus halophilus]|uniref:Uncharacterized protein n=1 Tax=Tigheibacillus halophilus TaxID=361280 RepID=A0ABU5C6J8_9BACI|nr:hypothetical protein [Virgibacillus halophilus]
MDSNDLVIDNLEKMIDHHRDFHMQALLSAVIGVMQEQTKKDRSHGRGN